MVGRRALNKCCYARSRVFSVPKGIQVEVASVREKEPMKAHTPSQPVKVTRSTWQHFRPIIVVVVVVFVVAGNR